MIWTIVFCVIAFVAGAIFSAAVCGVALAAGNNETIDLLYKRLNHAEDAAAAARLRARRPAGPSDQVGGAL